MEIQVILMLVKVQSVLVEAMYHKYNRNYNNK